MAKKVDGNPINDDLVETINVTLEGKPHEYSLKLGLLNRRLGLRSGLSLRQEEKFKKNTKEKIERKGKDGYELPKFQQQVNESMQRERKDILKKFMRRYYNRLSDPVYIDIRKGAYSDPGYWGVQIGKKTDIKQTDLEQLLYQVITGATPENPFGDFGDDGTGFKYEFFEKIRRKGEKRKKNKEIRVGIYDSKGKIVYEEPFKGSISFSEIGEFFLNIQEYEEPLEKKEKSYGGLELLKFKGEGGEEGLQNLANYLGRTIVLRTLDGIKHETLEEVKYEEAAYSPQMKV